MSTTKEISDAYFERRKQGKLKTNASVNTTRGISDAYFAKRNYANIGKDIIDINNAITDAYSGWKDADTMKGYTSSLSSTLDKVKGYKDYLTRYYGNDANYAEKIKTLADVENYFAGATDNLNYLTGYYGSHTNAKSFADQKAKDDAKAAELLKFQELAKNADFAEKSVYKKPHDDIRYYIDTEDPYEAEFYNINEGDLYRPGIGVDYNIEIDTISDDEKALYNYIAQTQGYEEAYNYLKLNADTLNYRKGKEIANSWAGRNLPILTSLISGVDSAQQGFTNAVNSIVNPNKERPTSAMQYAGGLITQREAEEGVIQGIAAQISQSIGQMTPQILVSLATGNVGGAAKGVASAASKILSMATLGASVYGNAYNEALQRGQDGWRAYGYGAFSAAVEIAAESFADGINLISSGSWGKTLATKLTGNKFKAVTEIVAEIADKPRIKYLLDALGEGAEEVFSAALEPALESFFLKETFDPASVEEMLYSGLLGALTSGVMNAPGVPGQVANYKYYSGMNQTLNDADIDTIRAEAMQMDKDSKSYNAAKEFEGIETKDLANRHRRRILESFDAENHEKASEIVGNAIARNYAESENKNDNVDKAAEKAAEMKGKYNTATDGKAYTKDGTEADFSDFTETVEIDEEGNAVFTAKDGRTLSTADDVVPEIVAEGVAMLANLPSIPKSAYSTYFQYLPKQTNTKAYTEAFETLFKMGQNAEGMKLATSAAFADAELDELSQGAIYLQGVNTRKSADEVFDDAVIKVKEAASKDGGFSYKEGKYDDSKIKNLRLSKEQKKIAQLAKAFTKFGLNVKFIASTKAERAKGTVGNGAFEPSTGTIILDINAGENESVLGSGLLWTISHELTHALKVTAPTEFATLQEYILGEMFDSVEALDTAIMLEKDAHKNHHPDEKPMTKAEAIEEIVARSCENILMDTDAFAKLIADGEQKTPGFAEKIVEVLTNIIDEIVNFFKSLSSEFRSDSEEANFFDKHAEKYEGLKEKWIAAFEKGMENAKVVYGTELTPGEEGVVVNEKGEPVAYSTKNGSVMLSMRTYKEEGRDEFKKYLEKCVKAKTLTREETDEMLSDLDEIYRVCSEFKDKYAPFSKWSDAEVIRDTRGKPVFSVVTPNGEYKMNLDFSLVCKKRRTLDAVFNEMARRGTIDNFELGQKSIVKINEIIRKYGFETACALCFVDAKRFRQASMADAFVTLYNELVRSLVPEESEKDIGFYNFSGNVLVKNVESKIDKWENSRLDFSHINHVMKTYDEGTVEYKAAKYIKNNAHARKLLLRGDFMSSAGFDSVKKGDPQILKLYNSKKGTGGPKAAFGDVQYLNEIIKRARSWTPAKAYSVGGIRVQSFSDYVPRLVFDYVQMIYDLAATKLPAHAYSKEALFVKQFGLTGIKINMSLIPAVAKDGIAPGLDKNGNYVWAGESFDFDTAKKIQNADGYTENCGTIAVGVSKEHIMKLLSDPEIRMVIPYHKSGLNPIVAHMNRISAFTDYTSRKTNPDGGQHTTDSEGKNVKEEFDFNKTLRELNDPKAAAQAYLDWCKERDYSPKFAEFSQHANYYKLLIDFTVYDKSGNYVPQRAVKAVFPKGEDAFGSMKELIEEGLEEDAVIEGMRDERLGDIVDEIERTIPKTEAEIAEEEVPQAETDVEARIMRSDRRTQRDAEYLDAVKRGDMETAQRMVDEAAYTKNYVVAGYHGTPNGGFTKFGGHKTRNGAKAAGSYWFAEEIDHAKVYKSYPQNFPAAENPMVYNVYLDIGNWADIGNGRVEALDYSFDGKGAATKELRAVAKAIAFKTQYKHSGKSETARVRSITQQLTEIGRNIYADFIWQITETQEFADLCKKEGLDSVVAWEEHKKYNSNGERETHMVKTYGVFSPEQIKSADPVTYDDNGNVIPLSERFKSENADIRYSDRSRNIDRDILANVLADSKLKQRYYSQKVFLQKYQDEQIRYDRHLTNINNIEKELSQLHTDVENAISKVHPSAVKAAYSKLYRREDGEIRVNAVYLNKIAKQIIKSTETRYSITEVAEMLNDVFAKWVGSNVDNNMITRDAEKLYETLVKNSDYPSTENSEDYKEIYDAISKTRVSLSDTQKQELKYANGKGWYKDVFGRFKFTADGVPLDSIWQEWADRWPHIFDPEATSSDMPNRLIEIRDLVKPGGNVITEIDPAEVKMFAGILYRNYIMAPGVMDVLAEKDQAKKLPRMYSQMQQLEEKLEEQYEKLQAAEEKMFTYEAEGLRDVIDSEIRRLNEVARKTGVESRRKAIHERVERASRAAQIAFINNSVKDTMKMLNADTKHKYVPDALKQPVINILTALDFTKSLKDGTVTKSSQALDDAVQGLSEIDVSDLKVQLAELKTAIKDNVTPGGDGFAFDLNEDTVEVLEDAVNKLAEIKEQLNNMPEKNIYSMDSESLEAVKVALKVLNTVIRNADKAFASGMDISDAARGTISEVSARPEANKGKVATYFRSNLYFKLVDPIRQFAKMGPEALKMFKALMEADSRRAFLVERVREFIQKEIGSENLKKWEKQTFTFDNIPVINSDGDVEVDKNGNEVTQSITVTATQIMALHCHWKRNQSKKHLANMNEDGDPIKTGGGVFRKKLDSGEYEESARVRFDDALVKRMASELSKEQVEAADKMQSYMSNELAELGNMVSYKRWGINAFTEKYYIPIVTKKGVRTKEDDSGKAGNLLKIINKSWTKRVLKHATGPMYIDSLAEAFTGHAIEMIDYNTFALPILDIVRWLNFENTANGADESVSQSIEKAFGKDGVKFVKTLIEDINGSSSKPTAGIGMQKFFLRNTKLALVGGKIKQVFLQPTSVVRATEVISYSSLRKGVGTVLKVGDPENNVKGKIELARKWSGTALWKSMGYIDTNFGAKTFAERILEEDKPSNIRGRITHDIKDVLKGIKDKDGEKAYDALVDASLIWMEKGDEIGWAVLWAACESDVLATHKNIVPKSDEFYKAVASLFDEVVFKTQVTDSVLAKSASLRSTNGLEHMAVSFMGEPIKSINGVIDVTERIVADSKRLGKKAAFLKHKNELFKEVTVFATQAFTVALVSAIADHIGDDEEDLLDYKLFIKKFGSNIFEEINPLMKIPYIADIANIVVYGYDSSRLDLEAFSEVQQAFTAVINGIQGDGKYTSWGIIMQILEAASLISGVSAQNMLKDAKDAWNATIGEVFEEAEWREKKK